MSSYCGFYFLHKKRPVLTGLLSWKRDSNPRPTDYESVALPTALFQRVSCNNDYYMMEPAILQEKFLENLHMATVNSARAHPTVEKEW